MDNTHREQIDEPAAMDAKALRAGHGKLCGQLVTATRKAKEPNKVKAIERRCGAIRANVTTSQTARQPQAAMELIGGVQPHFIRAANLAITDYTVPR